MFWCIANERDDSDSADVLDEDERNAFYAFMDQTCISYLYICIFLRLVLFLREKYFSKSLSSRKKIHAEFFRPGHSRKLIHAKIFEVGIREN